MSTKSEESALESVDLIMKNLRDVEKAFRQLGDFEHYNFDMRKFKKKRFEKNFQKLKQKYKHIREIAFEWLKENGINPVYRADYDSHERTAVDTPIMWQVQAESLHDDLQEVELRMRYGPPAPTGRTGAQNAYFVPYL